MRLTRRTFTLAGAALALGQPARASGKAIELEWRDLIPEEERGWRFSQVGEMLGVVQHGQLNSPFEPQDREVHLNTEYNGHQVRLPGYMVPIRYDGVMVKDLLLVPYIGACIHVPPPPPNQIVLVTTSKPYEMTGYFDAVYVTGRLTTIAVETELAEIGYVMTGARIEPYE